MRASRACGPLGDEERRGLAQAWKRTGQEASLQARDSIPALRVLTRQASAQLPVAPKNAMGVDDMRKREDGEGWSGRRKERARCPSCTLEGTQVTPRRGRSSRIPRTPTTPKPVSLRQHALTARERNTCTRPGMRWCNRRYCDVCDAVNWPRPSVRRKPSACVLQFAVGTGSPQHDEVVREFAVRGEE